MKITQIEIVGFGKLQNETISFDQKMVMVYGENEAGKSTIYHFIREILFGFPRKNSGTKDYTPKGKSLYGGKLHILHPKHGQMVITRIKSENQGQATVAWDDDNQGDEQFLKEMLHPLTKEVFEEAYSLEQGQLYELQSLAEGNIQSLLLSIGLTGSGKLMEQVEKNQKKMQEIYKPKGRVPLLNHQLQQYEELNKQITAKEQEEASYQKQIVVSQELGQKLEQKQENLLEQQKGLEVIERQVQHFPKWEEYQQLKQKIAHTDQGITESDFTVLQDTYQRFKLFDENERELQEEQLKNHQVVDDPQLAFYLNHEKRFQQLIKEKPVVDESIQEQLFLKKVETERSQEIEELAKHIGIKEIEKPFYPNHETQQLMSELSQKENGLEKRLEQLTFESEKIRSDKAKIDTGQSSRRDKRGINHNMMLYIGFLLVVAAVVVYVNEFVLVGITMGVLGIASLAFFAWKQAEQKKKSTDHSDELKSVDALLNELSDEQQQLMAEQASLTIEKEKYSQEFQFSETEKMEHWMNELTLRQRLSKLIMQQGEMKESIQVLDEQMSDYAGENMWLNEMFTVEPTKIGVLFAQIASFVYTMQEKKQQYMMENANLFNFMESIQALKNKKARLLADSKQLLAKYKLPLIQDIPLFLKNQQEFLQMIADFSFLEKKIADIYKLDITYDVEALNTRKEQMVTLIEAQKKEAKTLQAEYESYKFNVQKMEEDGHLADLYQKEAGLRGEINQLQSEWMTQKLMSVLTQDIIDYLGTQQFPALLSTCSQYFKELTVGRYEKVFVENGVLKVRNKNQFIFSVEDLSTGTKDQLYMAMRLSFIFLNSEEQLAPLLIDDSWLHYDQKRKHILFNLLEKMSEHLQIICFSSDVELAEYAKKEKLSVIPL